LTLIQAFDYVGVLPNNYIAATLMTSDLVVIADNDKEELCQDVQCGLAQGGSGLSEVWGTVKG
jgi:hypothetical protein